MLDFSPGPSAAVNAQQTMLNDTTGPSRWTT